MTCPRIKAVCVGYFVWAAMAQADAACNLKHTPLTNESRCTEYMLADRELNLSYQLMMKRVLPELKQELRSIQRNWIRWREEKCDEVQLQSGCNGGGLCHGVAHDYCVIDLTRQRSDELRKLLNIPVDQVTRERLQYSRAYD